MKRFLAWLLGYFWLPCPRCGRMFAGFEISDDVVIRDGRRLRTCRRCLPGLKLVERR